MSTHREFLANPTLPDTNGWKARHDSAVTTPRGFERPVMVMLLGWADYAESHLKRYESPIGHDGVLGDEWEKIGQSLQGLLNGETGRLDCATLDAAIRRVLVANGCKGEW